MRATLCIFCLFLCSPGLGADMPYDIVDAARRGDDHAVRKLLEGDAGLAATRDERGYTPLHWAGIRAHWFVFRQLLDAGAPVDAVGGDGGTPLHWACHHDRADMVRLLVDRGADIGIANQWGRTPLHVAARRGCRTVAELLLDAGADPNAPTKEGWTPLHVAFRAGHPDLVELLLARGADPERQDTSGARPRDSAFTRPVAIPMSMEKMEEFVGLYEIEPGGGFKIWRESDGLHIREFAPDRLEPVGGDAFICVQEPWRVTFRRDPSGRIDAVDVAFLRRTVHARRLESAQYVGSQVCKECHLASEHGGPYLQWIRSRHGAAYWRLATDWAALLAAERPAYRDVTDPIRDPRCLLCHVTAAQDPDALLAPGYRLEEGVGCEACHGPGSLYSAAEVMRDRKQLRACSGVLPDEKTCRKCHRNPERFDFETWWPKIAHERVPDPESSGAHGEEDSDGR